MENLLLGIAGGIVVLSLIFLARHKVKAVTNPPQSTASDLPTQLQIDADAPLDSDASTDQPEGSGAFGAWSLDADGLPVYRYELNHRLNPRAYYVNTQGFDRRDHWHQIGNDRITGLAGNDGVVQVFLADRGGIFLNRYAPPHDSPRSWLGYLMEAESLLIQVIGRLRACYIGWRMRDRIVPRGVNPYQPESQPESQQALAAKAGFAYAGGYSYLSDGEQTWATAYRYRPLGAEPGSRVFGIGYFETGFTHRDVRYGRRVYAPYGDDAVLLSDVEIENLRDTPVSLCCYEYWDVNIQQMRVQWIRSGLFASHGDQERMLINARFQPTVQAEREGQALRFQQQRFAFSDLTAEELSGFVDSHPPDVFLVNLSAGDQRAADYYYDKRAFFGGGTAFEPDAVRLKLDGKTNDPTNPNSMPYCLVFRHDIDLKPGETAQLRFAYGALPGSERSLAFLERYRHDVDVFARTQQAWKDQLATFTGDQSPILSRETTWHAYSLLSATLFSEFYAAHYTPQGSAYLYLHGADGVPRDQALFVLPLVYVRPALARQQLSFLMRLRSTDTNALPYAFVGSGAQDNALGLHSKPSDLDLFFLLAMAEYLSATGDTAFLHERYPLFLPGRPPGAGLRLTVLEHVEAAFKHLETLGLGPHDLLVIGSGDWDDSIVAINSFKPTFDRNRTLREGESIPNSQMALHVLPLVAALIAPHDAPLAERMLALAQTLRAALARQWDQEKGWFYRAWVWYYPDVNDLIGNSTLSLQAQVWALISGLAAELGIEDQLVQTIRTNLDDDSPTGAMLEPRGQVWSAVSQLLTWGYRRSDPQLAWRSLNRHTFASHAAVFPSVWFNIWTGPDGTNSKAMVNAGGTWASAVTPMTDFPMMNSNPNAMALLGLLRVCGIEPAPSGDGLDIAPSAPPERFTLHTELLHLEVAPGRIAGEYRAMNAGAITLHVHIPPDAEAVSITLRGIPLDLPVAHGRADLPLRFSQGERIPFEVVWRARFEQPVH